MFSCMPRDSTDGLLLLQSDSHVYLVTDRCLGGTLEDFIRVCHVLIAKHCSLQAASVLLLPLVIHLSEIVLQ